MKKYYKVVNSDLNSARAWPSVKYEIGKWVHAPRIDNVCPTKLFVFDSLENARRFRMADERIFECKILSPCTKILPVESAYNIKVFWEKYWEMMKKKQKYTPPQYISFIRTWEKVTTCCAVKLFKEIK